MCSFARRRLVDELTTNAPGLRMCLSVSFGVPSGLDWMPRTTRAGSPLNTLKKRERRRVYNAVLTDGGDERDRARHHERGQELVAMRYRKRAEITSNGAVMQLLPGRRNVSGRVGDAAVALEAPTTRNRRTNLVHTFT